MPIQPPNYTQIPNVLLDGMSDFNEPELRVALAVCRQTFGWHRETALLSISFLAKATGMSEVAVSNATRTLSEKGWIEKLKDAGPRHGNAFRLLVCDPQTTFSSRAPDPQTTFSSTPKLGLWVAQPLNSVKEKAKESVPQLEEPKPKTFKPPTVQECKTEALAKGMPESEGCKFFYHYEANGWMIGRSKMKSWKSAMATWRMNWKEWGGERRSDKFSAANVLGGRPFVASGGNL